MKTLRLFSPLYLSNVIKEETYDSSKVRYIEIGNENIHTIYQIIKAEIKNFNLGLFGENVEL